MNTEEYSMQEEEDQSPITFNTEDILFHLEQPERVQHWIEAIIHNYSCTLNFVNFIFCSDDYLHKLNVQYLDHDTLTDIITFPYTNLPNIEGDIFISIERIKENAIQFDVSFENELLRVIIHGILHLCGFTDKTPEQKEAMHQKENEALAFYFANDYQIK